MALVDAGVMQGYRLPELFSGISRERLPVPVSYPTSCSPQAWAAATPLLLIRTLLRFEPWVPHGKVWLAPALPEAVQRLRVERIPLAGSRVNIEVEGDKVSLEGLPKDVDLVHHPRDPFLGD
jgi:glycogen debranching enzyme